jgi:GTP-binding protein HflX
LTEAGVLSEDKLFATLDPTTRRLTLPSGENVLLTDTVGFIRNLPHQLVKAFESTLEEAVLADVLLIVLDASDPESVDQLEVTEQVLEDLGAGEKTKLYVLNKCDLPGAEASIFPALPADRTVRISAQTGEGVDRLLEVVEQVLNEGKRRIRYHIPNGRLGQLNLLYEQATVESVDYGPDCADVVAVVDAKVRGMMDAARIPYDIL